MSEVPSPAESPVPAIRQLVSDTVVTATEEALLPPLQITEDPVRLLRHRTSDLPSPSKSFVGVQIRNVPSLNCSR